MYHECDIPFSVKHTLSSMWTRKKRVPVQMRNNTIMFINRKSLDLLPKNSLHGTKRSRRTFEEANVEDTVQAELNYAIESENNTNITEIDSNDRWYTTTSITEHKRFADVLRSHINKPYRNVPYSIWNESSRNFWKLLQPIPSQYLFGNNNDSFQSIRFTIGMLLFSVCVYALIANVAETQVNMMLKLISVTLSSHFARVWPVSRAQLKSKFWNLISLPRCQRQVVENIVNSYVHQNAVYSRTNLPQIDFTIFNIGDVLRLQLCDPVYLRGLRDGLKIRDNYDYKTTNTPITHYEEGRIFHNLRKNGPLKWDHMFSFAMFVDGVKLSETESFTVVYLVNTLLPLDERFDQSNIIVLALVSSKLNLTYLVYHMFIC